MFDTELSQQVLAASRRTYGTCGRSLSRTALDDSSLRRFCSQWNGWAMRSRLEPIKKVARMIDRRLDNIFTHCRHQLTNAVAEGRNSRVMAIKRLAWGYRNVENFKDVIYFYRGGLWLYP